MRIKLGNIRKIWTAMAALLIMTAILSLTACGKKVQIQVFTYEENADGDLTITGLTEKGQRDSTLTIPAEIDGKRVTDIGREAFRDNNAVTKVRISNEVTYIAENAFLNCTKLEDITFSESLNNVGTNIVKNTAWEQRVLSENKEIIVGDILIEVGALERSYRVPDGIRYIASGVFYYNETLENVTLPDSLERIGAYAFAGCSKITVLNIPSQVTDIGYEAFLGLNQIHYSGSAQGSPWGALAVQ